MYIWRKWREKNFNTEKEIEEGTRNWQSFFNFWVGRIGTVRMAKVASVIYKFHIVSSILTFTWKKGYGQQSYSEHKL